eukprot:TRINITY_DN9296_c0_g1_i1.p1 TRINITY_DN9296_c0_g1~~TRINITY_DN9296_c0_g1_i1.p1  ORF type:complete len:111 (-),score=12.95 TRINITY_DN9296_c0_g1_i1:194-526(-)
MAKITDGVSVEGKSFHKLCFTCLKCHKALNASNYAISDLGPMCQEHASQRNGASSRVHSKNGCRNRDLDAPLLGHFLMEMILIWSMKIVHWVVTATTVWIVMEARSLSMI